MNKKELFNKLDMTVNKPSYSKNEVKSLIETLDSASMRRPAKLKKGDVYVSNSSGTKSRPVVIVKVLDDLVLGIPLTTTEDAMALMPFKSRFLGDNFFSTQVITSTYKFAMNNFSGVFDNNRELNKAIKAVKDFYIKNL